MKKEITIKIRMDSESDEFANFVELKGFDEKTPIQNSIEVIGFLDIVKQEELKKILESEVKI